MAEAKLTAKEREVLEKASHGSVIPVKSEVTEFKNLIGRKLLEHLGNNKFKASKLGLVALQGMEVPEEVNLAPKNKKAGFPANLKKPKATREELDAKYSKSFPWYVKGSISKELDAGTNKRTGMIKCIECGKQRKVYTSDIFQVKLCLDCRGKKSKAGLEKLKAKK